MKQRTLAAGIRRPFRMISGVLAVAFVLTVGVGWYVVGQVQPHLERTIALTRQVRVSHEAMLDQETGLRAWLITGDSSYLRPFQKGARAADIANRALDAAINSREGGADIVHLRFAQQAWLKGWVAPAASVDPFSLTAEGVERTLDEGRGLFDDYREVQTLVADRLIADRLSMQDLQRRAITTWLIGELLLIGGALALARVQTGRVLRSIGGPVDDLLETMDRIRGGELGAQPGVRGPQELTQIGDGLVAMTAVLAGQEREAAEHAMELAATGDRLRTVLVLAREIAGSLSVTYVAEAAAEAAIHVSGASGVLVRLLDGTREAQLVPVFDSRVPRGTTITVPAIALGQGVPGEAAAAARSLSVVVDEERVTAYPLVVGARVIGVFEVWHADTEVLRKPVAEVLETLAAHTAAALEAARLHRTAEELSQIDPLTQLGNRRRMDDDLQAECTRSSRYGRPLGVVMLDLDHFKALNDTYGHQFGDEVLERVAAVLSHEVRVTDTVYRYGGEELVILARESDEEDTAGMAERLRRCIESDPALSAQARVTASFGVAAAPSIDANPAALVAAADRALYAAKRAGRNTVVRAQAPTATSRSFAEASADHSSR